MSKLCSLFLIVVAGLLMLVLDAELSCSMPRIIRQATGSAYGSFVGLGLSTLVAVALVSIFGAVLFRMKGPLLALTAGLYVLYNWVGLFVSGFRVSDLTQTKGYMAAHIVYAATLPAAVLLGFYLPSLVRRVRTRALRKHDEEASD